MKNKLTQPSGLDVVIEGLHLERQTVDVIEDAVIQWPVQTIWDVHLVKMLDNRVVRMESVQRRIHHVRLHVQTHGTWTQQRRSGNGTVQMGLIQLAYFLCRIKEIVIIYLSSCCCKPVCISSFCWIQKKISIVFFDQSQWEQKWFMPGLDYTLFFICYDSHCVR